MKTCPQCQSSQQADDANFCDICSYRFAEAARPPLAPPSGPPVPLSPALPPTQAAGNCPSCGRPVLPGGAYCEHCRAPLRGGPVPRPAFSGPVVGDLPPTRLSLSCPACGEPLASGQRFCGHCGRSVTGTGGGDEATELLGAGGAGQSVTGPRLVVAGGAAFPLATRSEMVLGRDDPGAQGRPAIDLGPHGGEAAGVSRQHARLAWREGRWSIEDMGSINYTYVNNRKLSAREQCVLQHGDQIRVGRMVLTYFAH